ncbi:MAG: DUF2169 domain-containing protein [Candidatus Thiodiazotropha sp.]
MELLNATGLQAGYTMGMRPDGRELLVVAVKGTFNIPPIRQPVTRAEQQKPLIDADSFTGEPGFSAPLYEVDYAPVKPMCDVLLNGSAYAPGGKPTSRVEVTLRIGSMYKSFAVTGNRSWEAGKLAISPGYPELFERMPISYDNAFGGVDNFHENEQKHAAWMSNPVGCGYHKQLAGELVDGTPMPNTEELKRPVSMPNGTYAPMAFGPIGRGWDPRRQLAGTYDQEWIDNTFPFLPPDFSEEYFQAAPVDQQIPYLQGGERVFLENLTPEGQTSFDLPQIDMPAVFFYKNGEQKNLRAVIDTLVIEPDEGIFTLTWRASIPLRKNLFEMSQVLLGRKPRGWWRARKLGKTYYPTLAHAKIEKQIQALGED